jgi:Delta3-Delta2-enoyl-CoA isomerase
MLHNFRRPFATSGIARNAARVLNIRKMSNSSSPTQLVEVQKDATSKTAVIRMSKPPANSLNIDFMKQLTAAIKDAEKDASIHGFVLTSSNPKVFCAGLDLLELAKKDLNVEEFWGSLQELWCVNICFK